MITIATRAGVGLLLATMAMSPGGGQDYESLPPKAADVEAKLRATPGTLVDAVRSAELVLGGVAQSASIDLDRDPAVAEVLCYSDGRAQVATVELAEGTVQSVLDVPRFPGEPVEGEWIETDSGLRYFDIEEGEGATPAGPTSQVKVHYSGWLVTGEKFDSSRDRGEPITFPLARVIPGWTEGVGTMRVGGRRKLIIPFSIAYGEGGRPPTIPPRATLIFDVELLEVIDQ